MTTLMKLVLSVALSALLFSPALAEDKRPKKNRPNAATKEQPVVQLPKGIELTAEQKPKVAEIEKEFAAKMKEARENLDKVLTDEQKKARQEAQKEARTSGKKRKELQQAIKDATKATPDQEKKIEEADKALAELRKEILEKVKPILTDDQKAKLPQRREAGKRKAKKAA